MSMTKRNRRGTLAILAIVLVAVLSTGGTLAYLTYQTDAASSSFSDASAIGVDVLLTQEAWDNTQVTYDSDSGSYKMAETEYTLYGAKTRDSRNVVTEQQDPITASSGAISEGNLADESHRGVAYVKRHDYYDASGTAIQLSLPTPLESLSANTVKGSQAKVDTLGIARALTLTTSGTYAPKNPRVNNASTTMDAYVAIRVAFQTSNESLNTTTIQTKASYDGPVVDTKVADQATATNILSGLVFTNADAGVAAPSSEMPAGFNISSDWVADSQNGDNSGVYYFYYKKPLSKSSASAVEKTTELFKGVYMVKDAGRDSWSSGKLASTANYLDFMMDGQGAGGGLSIVVDAVGVQTQNLTDPNGEYESNTTTKALRDAFGTVSGS